MVDSRALSVEKILGSITLPDGNSTLIGFTVEGREYHLALSPALLMNVLLTAMKARTNLDENASSGTDQFTVLPCDKWEIRMLNKGAIFIFSFRVPGGAWIRLKVPQGAPHRCEKLWRPWKADQFLLPRAD